MVARLALRGLLIAGIIAVIVAPVVLHYRWTRVETKRLREVSAGRVYRCGQLSVDGFADAVSRFGIRTVLNLQNEYPDPVVRKSYWDGTTRPETEVCRALGVRYEFIAPDLVRRIDVPEKRPLAVEQFLEIMDDPESYPVLIHCRAGLHRTGSLVAVYRMEYEGWSPRRAWQELKGNGFGEWACTASNDYVMQYVLSYRPGLRARGPKGELRPIAPRHGGDAE